METPDATPQHSKAEIDAMILIESRKKTPQEQLQVLMDKRDALARQRDARFSDNKNLSLADRKEMRETSPETPQIATLDAQINNLKSTIDPDRIERLKRAVRENKLTN